MDHSPFEELSLFGWILVGAALVLGVWALWLSVRWTFFPGETEPDHPKRSILDDDAPPSRPAAPARPADRDDPP
jgi:hypothetical protein